MARVDKAAFERAMRLGGASLPNFGNSTPMFETIETGCQVKGCSRRSRVVIVLLQPVEVGRNPEAAVSFVCNKHAQQVRGELP